MPQTTSQWLRGYMNIIVDTLSQRLTNNSSTPNHAIFNDAQCLSGRTAIVTGANTGIGLETTRMLCKAGAHVILACRNTQKGQSAVDEIISKDSNASLSVMHIDLASLSSVRSFAANVLQTYSQIDMLVLNGGIMGVPQAHPEAHFMVNHVAHALLTLLLIPVLSNAENPRVVFVSSLTLVISDMRFDDLHFNTRHYNWMTAYANSKLLMVLFMTALSRKLQKGSSGISRIFVNAVHPGETASDVARHLGSFWHNMHKTFGPLFLLSLPQSARTSVYVAGEREISTGGQLYHRVSERLQVPAHLVQDEDVNRAWEVTLAAAEVSEGEIQALTDLGMNST